MKKLMTILVVFAMCGVAMASKPIDLSVGEGKEYGNPAGGYTGLKYTVTESEYINKQADNTGRYYNRYFAQAYFTTNTKTSEGVAFNEGDKINVQFLGVAKDLGIENKMGYDADFSFKDYGIYMYDPQNETVGTFYSALENNSFKLDPGQSFGVYFEDKNGHLIGTTGLVDTDKGVIRGAVGNWDDDPSHDISVGNGNSTPTLKHYMCLFEGNTKHVDYLGWGLYDTYYTEGYASLDKASFEQSHFEFMLQTTLDAAYIEIPDTPATSGQPLPGTLATLLIGSLCASALRKKNQK